MICMTLQQTLKEFGKTLATVSVSVFHYKRPKSVTDRYAVWQEEGEGESFYANNGRAETRIAGTLDYFTQTEFDSAVDEIQQKLQGAEGCSWRMESVQFEEETGLIHYEWAWEIGYGDVSV